jgi:signal transduction histidine kinase/putative methionine-R-sulfoxide reductase with GAF domain
MEKSPMTEEITSARLLQALASLNTISQAINNLDAKSSQPIEQILGLIGRSAVKVIPGSSAILYAYDETQRQFTACSSVTADERIQYIPDREPREHGLGARAIDSRQSVVSYSDLTLQLSPKMTSQGVKTGAAFPLIVGESIVGLLYVYLYEERHFSELELLLLENFVNQAAMAIFHAHRSASADQHLARKEEENARLRRAGMLISSRLDLQETLETILQMALEVLDAHYGVFRLVDKKGEFLISAAFAGEIEHAPVSEDLRIDEHSVMGWVAKYRQSLCLEDVKQAPWAGVYHPLYRDLEMRSELAVPLVSASGRLEGVLNLESPRIGAFSEADSHLLHAFATQATIAIQEVKLLESLKEISESILCEGLTPVLDHIICKVIELVNAVDCGIWLLDHQKLVLSAGTEGVKGLGVLPVQEPLLMDVMSNARILPIEALEQISSWWPEGQTMPLEWSHGLVLPLSGGDGQHQRTSGVLCVFYARSEAARFTISSWDEKVISILAHYAVLALQNRDSIEAVQHAQNQATLVETFAALGDVAANLLHQLNNKFGTIPVRVQGLQDRYADLLGQEPYLKKNLTAIEDSARQAMEIMQENLHLLHPIQKQSVILAECLKDTLQTCHIPASVLVEVDGLQSLPPVFAGYQVLRMVFANLIDNAIHAMQEKGHICITAEQVAGAILVRIEDDGPGIPDEIQKKIFEFQFSQSQPQVKQRMGFGLWWVRTIMARLGGAVWVQSDGQHGTIFTLQFPVDGSVA